jgi:hypothetical protein
VAQEPEATRLPAAASVDYFSALAALIWLDTARASGFQLPGFGGRLPTNYRNGAILTAMRSLASDLDPSARAPLEKAIDEAIRASFA